ncbi:MAG: type IV pilus modification protein PilV [Pseudomonadota bacterium]
MSHLRRKPLRQRGAAMMEVLIAVLITAFGVLGFVGLQAQTALSVVEGYQRAQALMLVNDMAERIRLNSASAASYVGNDIGVASPGTCGTTPGAARDLCEWSYLIQGASELKTGVTAGALAATSARGCITNPSTNRYVIALVWQGAQSSAAATTACGLNAFSDEKLRRAVTTVVQVATLTL